MKLLNALLLVFVISSYSSVFAQTNIGDFTSVTPAASTEQLVMPSTHTFHKVIKTDDPLTEGGTMDNTPDFTGYVPIDIVSAPPGSSTNGYLSINHEKFPGGNTVLDINFNATTKLWETTASEALDFSAPSIGGTAANCAGAVTPWGTVISSEEFISPVFVDNNSDGYTDFGWNVEIDPFTKTVLRKLWAMGSMAHENVAIHPNLRTVYQGADSTPGYLYKFIATTAGDLSDGLLYVYTGSKNGAGSWVLINNTTQADRNNTLALSDAVGATVFGGIEEVEIGPDGNAYFAVKNEGRVYRLQEDTDPLISLTATMDTFVGGMSYDIFDGTTTTSKSWSLGNDNMAFDGDGNLWVMQESDDNNLIWVVKAGHTQAVPDVELFAIIPKGAEPTGITFTPDYKFMFMSIQHPDSGNDANQMDAAGNILDFNQGISLVIGRTEDLGMTLSVPTNNTLDELRIIPNPLGASKIVRIKGHAIENVKLYSILGQLLLEKDYNGISEASLSLENLRSGIYLFKINNQQTFKFIVK